MGKDRMLILKTRSSEIKLDVVDTDGELFINIDQPHSDTTIYIVKEQAEQIIKHLQEQFNLTT